MIINHNMQALNAHRQMGTNATNAQKSMEKLSSGLRINRAGDDAAGLAISEKMRGQIRGLDQAGRNAQDGISLIQTAEGALNETHSILQRMRELSVQSSNGTNTNEDRTALQDEISQLKEEVNRIANTTEFNTQKLLNGELKSIGSAVEGKDVTISGKVFKEIAAAGTGAAIADASTTDFTAKDTLVVDGTSIEIDWNTLSDEDKLFLKQDLSGLDAAQGAKVRDILTNHINNAIDKVNQANGTNISHIAGTFDATSKKLTFTSGVEGNFSSIQVTSTTNSVLKNYTGDIAKVAGKNQVMEAVPAEKINFEINGIKFETDALTTAASGADAATVASNLQDLMNAKITAYNTNAGLSKGSEGYIEAVTIEAKDGRLYVASQSGSVTFDEKDGGKIVGNLGLDQASTSSAGNGPVQFQIGANKGQTISFGIGDMSATGLKIEKVDVSKADKAQASTEILDKAISSVSLERSKLGAIQNRLEHTINNLGTSSENLTAAESRIRDVDMAKEMMTMSKNNILNQAAQAMLAQANQNPQQVLQLLR